MEETSLAGARGEGARMGRARGRPLGKAAGAGVGGAVRWVVVVVVECFGLDRELLDFVVIAMVGNVVGGL